MSEWTAEELLSISEAEEVELTPERNDGSRERPVVMWAVTNGSDVFVRSVRGVTSRWYRQAAASRRAVFAAGELRREVALEPVNEVENQVVTDAYNVKYAAQPDQFRLPMVEGASLGATLKVVPL